MIVELFDETHVDRPNDIEHVIALEGQAIDVLGEGLVDGMCVLEFRVTAHDGRTILDPVHVVVRRGRDIGPVWLDVAEVKKPGILTLLLDKALADIRRIGRLRVLLRDAGGQGAVTGEPAAKHLAVGAFARYHIVFPGILAVVAVFTKIGDVGVIWSGIGMTLISVDNLETAGQQASTRGGLRIDTKALHGDFIEPVVGLAVQRDLQAMIPKKVSNHVLSNRQGTKFQTDPWLNMERPV
tara:strand:+ start:3484 stop:4200 length:717 start_codon:yes stop_codon:yes gene_type:complete